MNKYLKLLALFLAMVMLVSALASCGGGNGEETTEKKGQQNQEATTGKTEIETEVVTEDEWKPDIAEKNYNTEFYFWIMGDVNTVDYYWVKESSNDAMSDAVYERQEKVRKYLGVEIIGTDTESENQYVAPFQNAVKNKDGSVDLLISHVYYGIEGFVTGNYITDFNDIPEINLDAPYWKLDVMEGIGINDHLFLGFGDLTILYTHVITFNKELLAKYEDQMDEDIYSMVENYHWTLDKMMWLASLAYIDTNSDGKTEDDWYGLVGYQSVPFVGFMQASNINLVDMDESGNYTMGFYNEKTKQKMSDLVDKLYGLTRSEYACLKSDYSYPGMVSGRSLMEISGTPWLPGYLSSDVDFGIVPFPMYDENQKDVGYRSLQWGGYLCVPSYLGDATMVGETMEMMAYYSENVANTYYEKLLGKQVADAPLDRKMLQIVWDSVCSDFGQTYFSVIYNSNVLYVLPMLTKEGTTQNLSSYVASNQNTINRNLKKFMAKMK